MTLPLRVLFVILGLAFSSTAPAAPACVELFANEVQIHHSLPAALTDPLITEARELKLEEDFKTLADLEARPLTLLQKDRIYQESLTVEKTKGRREAVRFLLDRLYQREQPLRPVTAPELAPRWTLKNSRHRRTLEHIEKMWSVLTRKTPPETHSSLIPLPFPLLIPGARFQEGYYWDTYFAFSTLLRTGRENIVRGQIENFLFLLKNYSIIPNGTRDYYLSRSQPPLLSQMIREYVQHEISRGRFNAEMKTWLKYEVLPLVRRDYENFWMNPRTRFDARHGLNHHFDAENTPRPERHASDNEEKIAQTYRDVRAEAESGKDFTDAFEGRATHYAGVLLNSTLYGVEKNLAWMSRLVGENGVRFEAAAARRQKRMNQYLWDERAGVYRDYNLRTRQPAKIITADIFAALDAGLATPKQASRIRDALKLLERAGGLMASEKVSGKQWDAPYGWAPQHYFAMSGLKKYGFETDARRLGQKWVDTVDRIFDSTGKILEKIDAQTGQPPIETGDKYPTQDGFLWTNGVYAWTLTDVLGVELSPAR